MGFEIKAPVIAVSAQWYLERLPDHNELPVFIECGVETKPFLEAIFFIDLWPIFLSSADGVCPGAGRLLVFVQSKIHDNAGVYFKIIFDGSVNGKGQIKGNTLMPKEAKGTISIEGKIKISLEFKVWAKGNFGVVSFDGAITANCSTCISAGYSVEIDQYGVIGNPTLGFDGIVAKYIMVGSVKSGVFKWEASKEGNYEIVKPCKEIFEKSYLLGPFKKNNHAN